MPDRITVVGNVATQPEQRRTSTGIPVTSFRLASDQGYFDAREEKWVEGDTNWYQVSVFRTLGEHAFASLRKGQRVVLAGRLKLKSWESGEKKGLDVDIDVDAIGHDLKFGTSTFQKRPRPDQSSEPADATGFDGALDGGLPASSGADGPDAGGEDAAADWAPIPVGVTPF